MSIFPDKPETSTLKLFEAFGVELEYMIVDKESLEIRALADKLLTNATGIPLNDLAKDDITWSNELAMHLVEFNFTKPEKTLAGKNIRFHKNILEANMILAKFNAKLLPTGMHPVLKPQTADIRLWPYDNSEIYKTYDKIFNCKNHGWVNVQSSHLNLPFSGDDEFRRLHSAIRFVLPIIPALAASSPFVEGKISQHLDSRLFYYRKNQTKVPEIGGDTIPEIMENIRDYQEQILEKMYFAISPFDSQKILQGEWLNSRGAIARFDRSSIEIRLIDTQECALADLAVLQIISHLVKWILEEKFENFNSIHDFKQDQLLEIFESCIQFGDQAIVEDHEYLAILNQGNPVAAKEIWSCLFDALYSHEEKEEYQMFIAQYKSHGTLASRLLKNMGSYPDELKIRNMYHELSRCLAENKVYTSP